VNWKLNLIQKHIKSFPTMESHYCRADSTPLYLTIEKMYAVFVPFFHENLPPLVALVNDSVQQHVGVPSEKTHQLWLYPVIICPSKGPVCCMCTKI